MAAHLVANEHVAQILAEAVEQLAQEVDRVLARVHHVPVRDADAHLVGEVQHAGIVDPLQQRVVRLRRQVDQDAPLRMLDGRFHDRVERLEAVDQHRRGVARVEAHQRAVRAVGVEAEERHVAVDEVLRDHARHQRLADAALLAADEMDVGHGSFCFQPRPTKGILVAMTVWNSTLASSGRLAM